MKITKENLPLVLAFGVPLLFVLIFVGISLVPSFVPDPQYDLIYAQNSRYHAPGVNFYVEDGTLQATITPEEAETRLQEGGLSTEEEWRLRNVVSATFYRYHADTEGVEPLSYAAVRELTLSPMTVAPDGYRIERSSDVEGFVPFVFLNGRYGPYVLKKGLASKKIPVTNDPYNFEFIGWIIEE